MLVSYKWLKELVDIEVSSQDLAEKMSTTGIEVEGVSQAGAGLSKIVVGEVMSCEDVPDTHLHLCQVDTGDGELRQIVCGAPNVKAGIKVMVALPGARIKDNYKIKKGKIRGMESLGMICSLAELGISDAVVPKDYADGIYYLPDHAIVGEEVFSYLDLNDEIIELSITPNRADALSMRGVAHEVAAIYGKSVAFPQRELIEAEKKASQVLSVELATDKVPFYSARVIENVTIKPSPQWLQNTLMNQGIRPINNVVDVTNYCLLYFGQPMHAFDLDKFEANSIVPRQAKAGETLVTLDGNERDLVADDLVITVADKPVALAGIMGGANTEIDAGSKNVVLEVAVFDKKSIRKTSSRLGLRSESSARFEKGINQADCYEALDFAASLLAELSEGQVLAGVVSAGQLDLEPSQVSTNLDYVNTRLGTVLTMSEIEAIFDQLGFGFVANDEQGFMVSVPKRRWDITIPADLVEEIARIYGYDKLPTTLPQTDGTVGELTSMQSLCRQVQTLAEGLGLSEIITYALTTPEKALSFTPQPSQLTELMWPMTIERSALRQNLIAGMLDTVAYNVARKNTNLALYELGRVFEQTKNPQEDLPTENEHFALVLTGLVADKDFQTPAVPVDFFHAKGIVEALADKLGLSFEFVASQEMVDMHPGRTAVIFCQGQELGLLGQVHPQTAKAYNIPETYVAEINLSRLEALLPDVLVFQEISKYPSVSRDIALLVDKTVSHGQILDSIKQAGVKRLVAVKLFDVYAGKNIEAGKKSMAYNLTFQNSEASLTDEEVLGYMTKIVKSLTENLQVEVR
ncbi:phenylalanine--tRNA ligase subunit beta [Streptococcus cuniculipharyngis]|uniref:Phenylalanine--tRNA ligase beta subunit n=1 Tax=Streptococcus cuniculipharyngis TaxID=1562651 RepID=A0A5C5SCC6_9STRE|nr:phenylalanine--tRNA ligase subunit beta [Streptococcus cuniculipharyngis]TWS98747.1 phenylalanine--tRNA ligase subunit beta [Streptococcus cuniculipharyngis]